MHSDGKSGQGADDRRLTNELVHILCDGALPGELADFPEAERREAAAFIAEAARLRPPGMAIVRLESSGTEIGRRRMRLCIANEDMPFLVDSVAAAIAARGLIIHRLLHPVIAASRDADGMLTTVAPAGEGARESLMYLEIDRADARGRAELTAELHQALADVRAAVEDWPAMRARMRADAASIEDAEGRALLEWFADGAMTMLGFEVERPGVPSSEGLGVYRSPSPPDEEGGSEGAIRYFEKGGAVPLSAKAERKSTVHRRVPLDLVAVPIRDAGKITGIGVHAGLWTSQALSAPVEDVPVLRRRLAELEAEFGFDPKGHSGKALRHAFTSLPHDLLVNLDRDSVKSLVLTQMSLADRPRPTLILVRSILKGHLFAFVWLPRDELTTRRRVEIGEMLEQAAKGVIGSWSVELGDGDLALVRYTLGVSTKAPTPDSVALDHRLDEMVRGWEPAVEALLAERVGANRAARLALTYAATFPAAYRARYPIDDAAEDILRLDALGGDKARSARFYRLPIDPDNQLRLKIYRMGGLLSLSDVVPVLENFGFNVLKEAPTRLEGGSTGHIHEFTVALPDGVSVVPLLARADVIEESIAQVLEGAAENDAFNQLLVSVGLDPRGVVLLRAWFRYLRQTGLSYGLVTVVEALRKAPDVARGLIELFGAHHDPALGKGREEAVAAADKRIEKGLAAVAAIDEDRILRLIRGVIGAVLRTNAFAGAGREALSFKLDSAAVPGLPAPRPWREIWVYSPRIEGIHLRGGPIARGGLRWSDRRDDFRTEILGLMKAQLVKNAVIVPTGAKGGFYPKQLPNPAENRDAWLAEGTESYRIFMRALLSITDNIVDGKVVHPIDVTIHDGEDPYFVVAADKGTATFSDVANAIAVERGFWLGDAFASGGSQGYDHKAMGITAKGAWVSVQRHFREMGVDVQKEPITIAGVGDMSGDVFGNGMLLSKALLLVAAFDHRHIFLDPAPDATKSWKERKRLFDLPRSSWADYDAELISKGGGIFPRSQKSIPLSREVRALLGVEAKEMEPAALISAILRAPIDLIWFGGIGTYLKASHENNAEVGDPGNDAIRVSAAELRAKAIGEGANLGVTQAARIEFSELGGRINTDFIDNSAGVDCSDNEVNIKIPLNREVIEGRLGMEARNALLAEMTDDVSALVLEDNRLQTLALSIAERGGAAALPRFVRVIELLEESGRLNREVEGLESNEELLRRAQQNHGLTRPELAVLLSTSKMQLQAAIEAADFPSDPTLEPELLAAFPPAMRERHRDAILAHRLRREIIATKIANRIVNRLGIVAPFALTEEEGAAFGQAAAAFVAAERLFDMPALWAELDRADLPEQVRLALFEQAGTGLQHHIADLLRCTSPDEQPGEIVAQIRPGLDKLAAAVDDLLRAEPKAEAGERRAELEAMGAPRTLAARIVRLFEMNGAVGLAVLGRKLGVDEVALTRAYTRLGEALGLDWAQNAANHFQATDQWERLLTAGLARDFEQLRLDFLARRKSADPNAAVEKWVADQGARIDQFRRTVDRARAAATTTAPMLAQIATQARVLLGR